MHACTRADAQLWMKAHTKSGNECGCKSKLHAEGNGQVVGEPLTGTFPGGGGSGPTDPEDPRGPSAPPTMR